MAKPGIQQRHCPLVLAKQVHGSRIELVNGVNAVNAVDADTPAIVPDCDGFLVPRAVNAVNAAAGIRSADCLAICLCDARSRDYALVHSGWRGSRAGIAERALVMLLERGARAEDIHIAFSPSIQACCYEVGSEFREYFPPEFILERGGQIFFDNQGYVRAACLRLGVSPERVYPSPYCTACQSGQSDLFYSYRREGQDAGRILSVAYAT